MDKDILKYLDKVGQYVQGTSEKGFEVYVHGVFVESITGTVFGLVLTIISLLAVCLIQRGVWIGKNFNKKSVFVEEYDTQYMSTPAFIGTIVFGILSLIGIIMMACSLTGIFAPEYVAIKQIINGIGGK